MRIERGHSQDAPYAYWSDIHGNERLRCPRLAIFNDPRWYNDTVQAYNAYKEGYLPHAGGMMDQHYLFAEVMGTFDYAVNTTNEVLADRKKRRDAIHGTTT